MSDIVQFMRAELAIQAGRRRCARVVSEGIAACCVGIVLVLATVAATPAPADLPVIVVGEQP